MPVGRDIKDLDRLLRSKTRLSPAEKTVIARSLVDGTLYFHTNSIALLDIKTPNILTGFLSQSEEKGNVRTAWMCDRSHPKSIQNRQNNTRYLRCSTSPTRTGHG